MKIDEFLDTITSTKQAVAHSGGSWNDEIDEKIVELDTHISQHNYAKAIETFTELKSLNAKIQEQSLQLQERLASELDIQKKNLSTLYENLVSDFQKKSGHITELSNLAKEEIQKGDMKTALSLYKKISGLYEEIPSEFSEKKRLLHSQVMQLYVYIKQQYNAFLLKSHHNYFEKLYQSLQNLSNYINQKDADQAKQQYDLVKQLMAQFPQGFTEYRTQILVKMTDFENQLAALKHPNAQPQTTSVSLTPPTRHEVSKQVEKQPAPIDQPHPAAAPISSHAKPAPIPPKAAAEEYQKEQQVVPMQQLAPVADVHDTASVHAFISGYDPSKPMTAEQEEIDNRLSDVKASQSHPFHHNPSHPDPYKSTKSVHESHLAQLQREIPDINVLEAKARSIREQLQKVKDELKETL